MATSPERSRNKTKPSNFPAEGARAPRLEGKIHNAFVDRWIDRNFLAIPIHAISARADTPPFAGEPWKLIILSAAFRQAGARNRQVNGRAASSYVKRFVSRNIEFSRSPTLITRYG